MTEGPTAEAVAPPKPGQALTAAGSAFRANAKVLVGGAAIFLGANIVVGGGLQLIARSLGPLLAFLLLIASILPSIVLLPGLYAMALKAVRGQKPVMEDILLMFRDRFVHHVGLLMLQTCGALVCVVGVLVTQALFIPGTFLIIDRKLDWDGAMQECVARIKPAIGKWILYHVMLALLVFAGLLACIVGVLVTGPLALCAWAYAYDRTFAAK